MALTLHLTLVTAYLPTYLPTFHAEGVADEENDRKQTNQPQILSIDIGHTFTLYTLKFICATKSFPSSMYHSRNIL